MNWAALRAGFHLALDVATLSHCPCNKLAPSTSSVEHDLCQLSSHATEASQSRKRGSRLTPFLDEEVETERFSLQLICTHCLRHTLGARREASVYHTLKPQEPIATLLNKVKYTASLLGPPGLPLIRSRIPDPGLFKNTSLGQLYSGCEADLWWSPC